MDIVTLPGYLSHNTLVVNGKDQPRTGDRNLIALIDEPHFKQQDLIRLGKTQVIYERNGTPPVVVPLPAG